MALVSTVRDTLLRRIAASGRVNGSALPPLLWAAFLTLCIAGPWLLPGFLFGTDWPGPRTIPFPTGLSSSAVLQIALAIASRAIGGESTGKILVLASLFSAGFLAYRAVPRTGFV